MSRLAFLFGLGVIALLVISLYRAKSGAEDAEVAIAEIEAAIEDGEHRKMLLEAEYAHLSRREWIEEYARNELGMGPAKAQQFASEAELDVVIGPAAAPDDERIDRDGGARP